MTCYEHKVARERKVRRPDAGPSILRRKNFHDKVHRVPEREWKDGWLGRSWAKLWWWVSRRKSTGKHLGWLAWNFKPMFYDGFSFRVFYWAARGYSRQSCDSPKGRFFRVVNPLNSLDSPFPVLTFTFTFRYDFVSAAHFSSKFQVNVVERQRLKTTATKTSRGIRNDEKVLKLPASQLRKSVNKSIGRTPEPICDLWDTRILEPC